jgi:alkanesulfonate monooxygenase SsuD/methylene tetrahydromethanopterin reductase-like flavin-dependent oxidoreductase (luciferase family)
MDEQVQAMKAIWSSDPAEFHGRMVDFDPISCGPRPVQGGGPQVLVGGEGRATLDRIVRYADGWLPRDAFIGAQSLRDRVGEFRETCAAAGRGRLRVVILTKDTESPPDYYADADVDEIVITVPPADASSTARTLDLVSLRYHAWLSSGSGQSPQSVA